MRLALSLPLLLALGPAALAAECDNSADQASLTQCAHDHWQAADAALNEAYKAALAMMRQIDADLPKEEQGAEAALRAAQRAWLPFRDEACRAEGYMMHGGSAEPMVVAGCMARLTEERTQALRGLAEGY